MRWLSLFLLILTAFQQQRPLTLTEHPPTIHFPAGMTYTLDVAPDFRLEQAQFYATLDGVFVFEQSVPVPLHQAGDRVTLTASWDGLAASGEVAPPFGMVQTWWHLTDEVGNAIVTEKRYSLYQPDGTRNWTASEGQSVTIYTYEQSDAFKQRAVEQADAAMQRLEQSYGFTLPYRPVIVYYNSADDGDNDLSPVARAAFGSYFGGRAYPGTNTVVALATYDRAFNESVIPHELSHLFQFQLGALFFQAPHWWREGDARLHDPATSVQESVQQAQWLARQRILINLLDFDAPLPTSKAAVDSMMQTGTSFIYFLNLVYGAESHARFYANWRTLQDFQYSFHVTYGKPLTELESDWRDWLLDQYNYPVRVTADLLNVRIGPGVEHEVLLQLTGSAIVTPIGRSANDEWLFIETATGERGWVSAFYTEYHGNIQNLPVQSQ
jgi:hypothetical protein